MNTLKIRSKLYLVFALFTMPVLYLVYSIIATQNIAIDSTALELQGSQYLSSIRDLHYGLVGVDRGSISPAETLRRTEMEFGNGLDSADASRKVIASLGQDDDARAALRDLISKVGDTSALILDPDLDSFYVMDSVVVNIPDLIDRVFAITRLAAAIAGKETLLPDDKTEYLIEKGGLQTTAANLQSDYDHASKGSTDGSVKAHLESHYAAAAAVLQKLLTASDATVLQKTGQGDAGVVTRLGHDALLALRDLNRATAADLDRLLGQRIDGFMTERFTRLGIAFLLFLAVCVLGGRTVAKGIVWPVEAMIEAMTRLADGDHSVVVPGAGRTDEIGRMARAILIFEENMIRADHLTQEQERTKAEFEGQRSTLLQGVSEELERETNRLKQIVETTGQQFSAMAQSLSTSAEQTEKRTMAMGAATEQASANVETVAAAAGQLAQSIHDIGRQVEQSTRTAELAANQAKQTEVTVRSLSESSSRIGEVVKLISDVASQTNLLALNATIEAARAGDAGKGFAVVAGEVKNLANQTARATDEITQQVTAVQTATQQAVQAINGINARIAELQDIAATIAAAVNEQAVATSDIARNVRQASEGTRGVADSIGDITLVTKETAGLAREILDLTRRRNQAANAFIAQVFDMARSLRTAI